jgi:peptide/nickel transport system permease protein
MLRFIVRRVLWAIPVLVIGTLLVFLAVRATTDPVKAAVRNPHTTAAALAKYKHDLGLDKSWLDQYWIFLKKFVRGDFGVSLHSNAPVWPDLKTALANSVVLGVFSTAIAIGVGVALGIVSALRQYSIFDNVSTGFAFLGLSMPPFWFGLLLIILCGTFYQHHISHNLSVLLPFRGVYDAGYQGGFDLTQRIRHLILPGLTLAVQVIAVYSRYMRTSMLENLNSDYLRTARAKGISEWRVIIRHAFRNALIPLTTFAAIDIGAIAGGLIITEQVFQYPGMGLYFLNAYGNADYTAIMPWMMIVVAFVVAFNLLADLSYAWLDPRIRLD